MAGKFKVTFTLDEEDANYFRNLYRKAKKSSADHDPQEIIKDAMSLVERWGMVAGTTGTEDSAGRAKVELATVEQVVERAIDTTELFFERARQKGWIVYLPDVEELAAQEDEAAQARLQSDPEE